MMVICVNNQGTYIQNLPLTVGKMYEVIKTVTIPFSSSRYDDPCGPYVLIKCDNGEFRHIEECKFRDLTTSEKRELKLNQII